LRVEPGIPAQPSTFNSQLSPGQRAWRRFRSHRPAVLSAWFLLGVVAFAFLFPLFSRYQPEALSDVQFAPPSAEHWLGTDVHGRDVLVRLCHGAQISLLVGGVGAFICLVIGVIWGAVAGFAGGRTDNWMMRTVDVLYCVPSVILAIVFMAVLEPIVRTWLQALRFPDVPTIARLLVLFLALGAVSWLTMARIVRGQVLSLRTQQFVDASRVMGATPLWILRRHIVPNVLGIVIVYLTLSVPSIILAESFLSFMGIGIQPPMASWGSLIAEGAEQINPLRTYWWLLVFPGGVLVATLLALNFLGDGLREAWDVRNTN
jgi:peptide/nickel transport system permease protein/oligopeptide transport system permease protein